MRLEKSTIENSFDVSKEYTQPERHILKQIKLPKNSNLNSSLLNKIATSENNTAAFDVEKRYEIDLIVHMILDISTIADKIMNCIKHIWNPFTIIASIMPVYTAGKALYELFRYKFDELWKQVKDVDSDEAKELLVLLIDSIKVAFK